MAFLCDTGTLQTTTAAAGNTVSVVCTDPDTGNTFQPKFVIFVHAGRTAVGQSEQDHKWGMGYAVSTTDRGGATTQGDYSPTTMNCDGSWFTDACFKMLTTGGAVDGSMDLQSMNSDGFTLVIDDAFAADYLIHWIAFGGGDITNVASVTATVTGTGNTDITSVGFQPDAAFVFSGWVGSAAESIGVDTDFCFGAVDTALTNYCLSGLAANGIGTSNTCSYCIGGECWSLAAATDSVIHRASITAWLSNGFRINTAELGNNPSSCRVLCVKGGRWTAGDILSQTTVSTVEETGVGFQPKGLIFASHDKAQSTNNVGQAGDERSVGFARRATDRNYCSIHDKDNAGTADIGVAQNTDAVFCGQNSATVIAIDKLVDLDSLTQDGFNHATDDADASQSFIWYLAAGANAGFTGSGSLTVSNATASGSATFAPGTKTASGALSVSNTTASGSATHTTPVYTASGALTVSSATASGSATFTESSGTFTGSGALTVATATASGSATFTVPVYTATGALTVATATASGSATFSPGTKTASGALTAQAATASGSATFSPGTKTASGALSVSGATSSGSATFSPGTKTASGALTVEKATLSGVATHTAPTYTASGALTASQAVASGSALFATAVYQASGALNVTPAISSGSATHTTPTYTASGALNVTPATSSGSATHTPPIYTGAGAFVVSNAILAGSATFTSNVRIPVFVHHYRQHGLM